MIDQENDYVKCTLETTRQILVSNNFFFFLIQQVIYYKKEAYFKSKFKKWANLKRKLVHSTNQFIAVLDQKSKLEIEACKIYGWERFNDTVIISLF